MTTGGSDVGSNNLDDHKWTNTEGSAAGFIRKKWRVILEW